MSNLGKQFIYAGCAAALTASAIFSAQANNNAPTSTTSSAEKYDSQILPINPPLPAGLSASFFIWGGPFSPYEQRKFSPEYKEAGDVEAAEDADTVQLPNITTKIKAPQTPLTV